MPQFLRSIIGAERKDTLPVNTYEGVTSNGALVVRDRRGTRKAEIPNVSERSLTLGSDPLAIYKPDSGKRIDAAKAMAAFTGWTYAAVNAIAGEVAGIELRLFQIKGKDHQEVQDHALLDLLDTVNPHMTGIELKYVTMAHLELTGNAFWLLDGASSPTSPPRAIYPLNPAHLDVKLNKGTFPYKLSHYEYTVDGKVYKFQPHQILHIKYPDPQDPFVGIGIPQTIPTWIDADNYAMEYNRKFFVNGAQVGLYIQTDTNVEGNIDRIRKSWDNRQAGVENAHKTPVLPKGVKLEHSGVTHKDMDFSTLANTTRDRILAGFRVSKTILGTAESDTNRATAETADYVFSKRTIKPKMMLVISYINEFLVPRYGDDLYLTFVDPTPEDREFRAKEMQAAMGNAPLMTANEARKHYMGLGPIEGGDQLMAPTTMQAVGTTDKPEGEDMSPNLAKTSEGWATPVVRVRTGGKSNHSAVHRMRRGLAEAFKHVFEEKNAYEFKSVTDLSHHEYMEHWNRFVSSSENAEAKLKEIFLGINAKQKQDVLENLPEATGIKKAIGELFDSKEWIGLTIDLVTPVLAKLAHDEAVVAFSMVGAQQQDILGNEAIRNALDRGIAKMARSYNETTLAQLKEKLEEKLNQDGGTNLRELTDTVDGVYSFADERRAGLIAKTEAFRTANLANKDAWALSGVVKTIQWFTAEDDKVCPFCTELDGKEIGVEQNFYNQGETMTGVNGETRQVDYGDMEAPPAHPDCRCYIRPGEISID